MVPEDPHGLIANALHRAPAGDVAFDNVRHQLLQTELFECVAGTESVRLGGDPALPDAPSPMRIPVAP